MRRRLHVQFVRKHLNKSNTSGATKTSIMLESSIPVQNVEDRSNLKKTFEVIRKLTELELKHSNANTVKRNSWLALSLLFTRDSILREDINEKKRFLSGIARMMGGAQWAKSEGEAVLLGYSGFTKDPMHNFNRLFCWNSCECEFWPYIMYLLEYKHEKVHASDDKSLKMNDATLILK